MRVLAIPISCGLTKPNNGAHNRFSHIVAEIVKGGNEVVVLESTQYTDALDSNVADVISYDDNVILNRTLSILRGLNLDFAAKLSRAIREKHVDIIQITHPSGVLLASILSTLAQRRIPIVYDAYDVASDFVEEIFSKVPEYSRIEKWLVIAYTKLLEWFVCRFVVDHITPVSEKDMRTFISKYGVKSERITVIPSGCTVLSAVDENRKRELKRELGIDDDKTVVMFHGSYLHPANTEAFDIIKQYIGPRLVCEDPRIVIIVWGTGFPKFDSQNIRSLGFVEDPSKVIPVADLAIVPLLSGTGTKLKIMDYMAMGIPVLTTEKGAEGIDATNMENVVIARTVDEDFIRQILNLLKNDADRKRIGMNGQLFVQDHHSWPSIGVKVNQLYGSIVRITDEDC
jgi:glycosyltransferase involved in cell wall biosynthesis